MTSAVRNIHFVLQLVFVLLPMVATTFELNILHTNDFHARVEEINKYGGTCSQEDSNEGKCFGGSARLSTMVHEKRRESPNNTILLSGGDQFQGTLLFSSFGGKVLARFMNIIGYEAMAIGNHEFDNGVSGLLDFAQDVTFPLISSNLDLTNTPSLQGLITKSTVLDVGGQQIGIVGHTTTDTSYLSSPETVTFNDELESVQAEVDQLTSRGINKIIVLGHSGFEVDTAIAHSLRDIDVVVGGHTNTFLYNGEPPSNEVPEGEYPHVVDNLYQEQGVLVVQAYTVGKYLGELHVTFDDDGKVTDWSGNPILLDSSVQKDPIVMEAVNEYLPQLEALRNDVIGYSHVYMDNAKDLCRRRECNLGNMVTDAMIRQNLRHSDDRYWSDVSIAVVNSGGLREIIPPGPITTGLVLSVLPFRNVLNIIEIKGWLIRKMLEHGMSRLESEFGGFLQVAGLQVTYDHRRPAGFRVVEVLATCSDCQVPKLEPLRNEQNYKMIIPVFLIKGGDDFGFIEPNIISEHLIGDLISTTAIEYITQTQKIFTGVQNRIQLLSERETSDIVLQACMYTSAGTALQVTIPIFFAAILSRLIFVQ